MKTMRFGIVVGVLVLFSVVANTAAQDYTTWELPEGAKARLGKGSITDIKYSPDGAHLAVASGIGIWIYDAQTGEEIDLLTGHTALVRSVVYSPDGETLASGGYDGIRLWDADTGEQLPIFTGHTGAASSLAYSPDGRTLASTVGHDGIVRLWDVNTGRELRTLAGHTEWVNSLSYSPDGRTLASGSWGGTIRIWDVNTGEERRTLTQYYGASVAYSPDGTTLASGSDDGTIRIWDVNTGEERRTLAGHIGWLVCLSYSPDGGTLATGRLDGTVRLWDVNTGEELRTLTGHTGRVFSVAYSPDGRTLASGSDDGALLRLWDVNTGHELRTLTKHHGASVAYSPDGRTLANGSWGGTIRIWDVNTGHELRTLTGHTGRVFSVAYSPDGRTLASGSDDGALRLWDVNTGHELRTLTGHTDRVFSVAYSPDGTTLASGSGDGTIRIWDVNTGHELRTLTGHTSGVSSIAYSPDGRTLASGSGLGTLRLWNVNTGHERRTLTRHTDRVYSVAYSPDGTTLASVSSDLIRLWDANTGHGLRTLTGHTSIVHSIAYSPDGRTLASGSSDGTILLWELNPAATSDTRKPITPNPDPTTPDTTVADEPQTQEYITGPWLWMISPTTEGVLGAQTIHDDSLAAASNGAVTEECVATNGAKVGDSVADYAWTLNTTDNTGIVNTAGFQGSGIDNIADVLKGIGWTEGKVEYHASYALITLESTTPQNNVLMRVGSDNAVKVWLNGTVVHTNLVDRASNGFQDEFRVNLRQGDNLLLVKISEGWGDWSMGDNLLSVKISEGWGDWSMFVGTDANVNAVYKPGTQSCGSQSAVTRTVFRVKGGTAEDYTDSQGRVWQGSLQSNQEWGGWIGKRPLRATAATLTANAQAQAKAAGYDAELFHAVSWARHADTLQYQFKTGNGTFDVTYLVSEHWSENRGFAILIEGEVVAPLYVTPGLHEIDIKTYRGIEVRDGTLDIQLKGAPQSGVRNVNPMFSALEVVSSPLGAVDAAAPMSVVLVPEATTLLPNYPNPFNPETWIPYQLSAPADVTVQIYGIKGTLVRTLALGHQAAGVYHSRSRAAYWDGRNAFGERVASGVYFYTLTAGGFTATRKLLIRK